MSLLDDILHGSEIALTGAAAGAAAGGPAGALLGGIYGGVKGGLTVSGGGSVNEALYQTAIPTFAAGLALRPALNSASSQPGAGSSPLFFSQPGAPSLLSRQLSAVTGEVTGAGTAVGSGLPGAGTQAGGFVSNLLGGIGTGLKTLFTGQLPQALANLFGGAAGVKLPPGFGGLPAGVSASAPSSGAPPTVLPIVAPGAGGAIQQADMTPFLLILGVVAALIFFFKKR